MATYMKLNEDKNSVCALISNGILPCPKLRETHGRPGPHNFPFVSHSQVKLLGYCLPELTMSFQILIKYPLELPSMNSWATSRKQVLVQRHPSSSRNSQQGFCADWAGGVDWIQTWLNECLSLMAHTALHDLIWSRLPIYPLKHI